MILICTAARDDGVPNELSYKDVHVLVMIYRRFYGVCDSDTLLQLYLSYVRPFVEYAAPVWDPHLPTQCKALEKFQKFSLRMSSKQWQEPYDSLLLSSGLHTLESRRKILKLSLFGQVMHGTVHVTHKLPQFV